MVDIEDRIFTRLTGVTGVSALVGTRVWPVEIPQKNQALPAITYQKISAPREHAHGADPGNVHARFQVTYFAGTPDGARDGAVQVGKALSRYSVTSGATVVEGILYDNEIDLGYDPERKAWARASDFIVHYRPLTIWYPSVTGGMWTGFSTTDTGYRFTATGGLISGASATGTWVMVGESDAELFTQAEEL